MTSHFQCAELLLFHLLPVLYVVVWVLRTLQLFFRQASYSSTLVRLSRFSYDICTVLIHRHNNAGFALRSLCKLFQAQSLHLGQIPRTGSAPYHPSHVLIWKFKCASALQSIENVRSLSELCQFAREVKA